MISVNRAKIILECYGSHPSNWPPQERDDLQQLLTHSDKLKAIHKQMLALDDFMGFPQQPGKPLSNDVAVKCCADKILVNLPQHTQRSRAEESAINSVTRDRAFFISQRPILLLTSVVVIVFSLFSNFQSNQLEDTPGLSLSEYMELYVEDDLAFQNIDEQLEILAFLEPQLLDEYN